MKKTLFGILKGVFGGDTNKPVHPVKISSKIQRLDRPSDASLLDLRGEKLAKAMLSDPYFLEKYEIEESQKNDSGLVDGRHYTTFVDEVKALKRTRDHDVAAGLLLRLIDAVEEESKIRGKGWSVASWYYVELAIIYPFAFHFSSFHSYL